MPPVYRTGLLIIRAWVEKTSTKPLRAHIRTTADVSQGFENELMVADVASANAVVETWLGDVLEQEGVSNTMTTAQITTLDPRFSSPDAAPVPWGATEAALKDAEVFWVTTVRTDGRPHVVPLLAIWHADALYFCTGVEEQKYRNIEANNHVVLTTGCNRFREGLDVVVEGEAVQTRDEALLNALAAKWQTKFDWTFEVRDGVFHDPQGGDASMFEVRPSKVLAFGRGDQSTQTRYRFNGNGEGR